MRWRKQTAAIKGSLVFQEPMAQELLHHFYTVSTSDNTNIYTLWCLQDIRRRKIPNLSNVAPPVKGVQLWGVKYNARKVWKARTPQSLSCVGAPQSFSCVLCGCTFRAEGSLGKATCVVAQAWVLQGTWPQLHLGAALGHTIHTPTACHPPFQVQHPAGTHRQAVQQKRFWTQPMRISITYQLFLSLFLVYFVKTESISL